MGKKKEESHLKVAKSPSKKTTNKKEKDNKPVDFNLHIHTFMKKQGEWKSEMKDEGKVWEGIGETPLDSIRSLLNNIELSNAKDEQDRVNKFMQLNFDKAKALCLQIRDLLGPKMGEDWFTVYQLVVKTGMKKEELMPRIEMLQHYGLLQNDREVGAGQRWRIVKTPELQKEILDQKIKIAQDTVQQLKFQREELVLKQSKKIVKKESNTVK